MIHSVRNRRDLARFLQAQMAAARFAWTPGHEEDDLEVTGRTAVKTYLVEAHRSEDRNIEASALVQRLVGRLDVAISETDDPDLVLIRSGESEVWVDASLGRFWRLHTVAPVQQADPLHAQIVAASPWLDNVWLPSSYLEGLPERTQSRMQTFSLSHDRRPLHREDAPSDDLDFVTLRLWSSRPQETLGRLRQTQILPHGLSIRSVKLRSEDGVSEGDYCVAEYFHHGKVTATGTSFDEHTRILVQVLQDYRAMVERIERDFGMGYVDGSDGCHIVGNPIEVEMEWTVKDLEFAVRRIFSCSDPFRLWALPERVGPDHYRAHAVDLHIGGTLTFDITDRNILIRLPRGTCGNTVLRFLGNLHYHVNSDAGAELIH